MSGVDLSPGEKQLFRIVQAIINIGRGASNAGGTVTLRAGFTTTVVTSANSRGAVSVSPSSRILLTPTTANAAAVVATTYVSSVGQETFTITHPNNANVDKTFFWEAKG